MILRKIDFLSPKITLYHKGFLSHSSIISGVISVISFIIIIIFAIYYSLDLIRRQNPKVYFFNRFVEDAGLIPLNSSSLFHYISFGNVHIVRGFDFYSFRLVGFEKYYSNYIKDRNLSKFDHWLYGLCNYDINVKEINDIINRENFEVSACIRKFYNSTDGKYYDIDDQNFKWPVIEHGTTNPEIKSYSIVVERCEEDTLELILGKGNKCKNDLNIDYLFDGGWEIHLNFIDHYIDILDYKAPNIKYFYRIENTFNKNTYSINHINFNPSSIITNNGIILQSIETELSYRYERNDVFTEENKDNIYMVYNFWLKNTMYYYKRIYKRIQDVISDIGGISQFITMLASFINSFYNKFKIILNFEQLISPSINNSKDSKALGENIEFIKLKNKPQFDGKKYNIQIEKNIINSHNNMIEKQKISKNNSNINIYTRIKENGDRDDSKNIFNNDIQKLDIIDIIKNENKSFCNFLIYKISCNKKNI